MKKQLLFALALLTGGALSAQITITGDNVADVGYSIERGHDFNSTIQPGNAGADQTWIFLSLDQDSTSLMEFGNADEYTGYNEFPDATIGMDEDGSNFFFRKNATAMDMLGIYGDPIGIGSTMAIPFDPQNRIIEFPSTYNSEFTNEFEIDVMIHDVPDVDSARFKQTTVQNSIIDAWGEVTTPLGTFDAIRQFMTEERVDSVWIYIFGQEMLVDDSDTTIYSYNYWSDSPFAKFPLVEFEYDMENNQAVDVAWLLSPPVTEPDCDFIVTETITNASCDGIDNGMIELVVSDAAEPVTYLWNTDDETATIDNLAVGMYEVTITDDNGCSDVYIFSVEADDELDVEVTSESVTCYEGADGSLSANALSGNDPFTYNWVNGPQDSENYTDVSAGEYWVEVIDNDGCTALVSGTVEDGTEVTVSITTTPASCFGEEDGSLTAAGAGGTDPYTYQWEEGPATADYENVGAGDYMVTVTDNDGCEGTGTGTVTEPNEEVADFTIDQDGPEVTFNNSSSTGDYAWDFGDGNTSTETSPTHTYEANDTYTVCLTVTTDCGDFTHCDEVEVTTVGMNSFSRNDFNVYPNPASNQVFVEINSNEAAMIQLFDLSGRIVKSKAITTTISEIDVNNLSSGTYIYHIRNNEGASIYVDKLTINR